MTDRKTNTGETDEKPKGSWVGTGRPGPGRKKGEPNKQTAEMRAVLHEAAQRLADKAGCESVGEYVAEWASRDERNERTYWKDMWGKMLPKDIKVESSVVDVLAEVARRAAEKEADGRDSR